MEMAYTLDIPMLDPAVKRILLDFSNICRAYRYVKTYGVDRTFLFFYNQNSRLDRILQTTLPGMESFSTGDPKGEYSILCLEAFGQALKDFGKFIAGLLVSFWNTLTKKFNAVKQSIASILPWTKAYKAKHPQSATNSTSKKATDLEDDADIMKLAKASGLLNKPIEGVYSIENCRHLRQLCFKFDHALLVSVWLSESVVSRWSKNFEIAKFVSAGEEVMKNHDELLAISKEWSEFFHSTPVQTIEAIPVQLNYHMRSYALMLSDITSLMENVERRKNEIAKQYPKLTQIAKDLTGSTTSDIDTEKMQACVEFIPKCIDAWSHAFDTVLSCIQQLKDILLNGIVYCVQQLEKLEREQQAAE